MNTTLRTLLLAFVGLILLGIVLQYVTNATFGWWVILIVIGVFSTLYMTGTLRSR